MSRFNSPLDRVRVAAPCTADWDAMVGDERVRFCHQCERNVYNLSHMSKKEAGALVGRAEGRLCVRFYRRADGTILTRNCPVGLSAVRRRVARVAGSALSAVVAFFAGLGINFGTDRALSPSIMEESAVPAPHVPPTQFGYGPVEPRPPRTRPVEAEEGRWMMSWRQPPEDFKMGAPGYAPRGVKPRRRT